MGDWLYSDIVKDHFIHPRNILHDDEEFKEDGKGLVGNIKCGDQMLFFIKVDREKEVITECRWKTYGCASAIASTSLLSEAVIGLTLDEAYRVSPKDIADRLGGLPEYKVHCSVLGDKALRAAIDDFFQRNNMEERIQKEKANIICKCMNITDQEIEDAVLEGARTYHQVQEHTKIGTVCGSCKEKTEELLGYYIHIHFE